jgi:hypothetical protein
MDQEEASSSPTSQKPRKEAPGEKAAAEFARRQKEGRKAARAGTGGSGKKGKEPGWRPPRSSAGTGNSSASNRSDGPAEDLVGPAKPEPSVTLACPGCSACFSLRTLRVHYGMCQLHQPYMCPCVVVQSTLDDTA